jgi:hypothetical protein
LNKLIESIYKFWKSILLAIILIAYIVILSIIATLIPQGREPEFYKTQYGVWSNVIIFTGFDNFFHSLFFVIPVILFSINLLVCTIDRIVKRFLRKAKLRFGPDLIHIGLLILVIGGAFTLYNRVEYFILLEAGNYVEIDDNNHLYLTDFEYQIYEEDGRSKDWLSTVELRDAESGDVLKEGIIEVNKPFQFDNITVYQHSYEPTEFIELIDNEKNEYYIKVGDVFRSEDNNIIIYTENIEQKGKITARFQKWKASDEEPEFIEEYELGVSDVIRDYIIKDIRTTYKSGLNFVKNSGFLPIIISLIIMLIGLALTFIQKAKDGGL